LGHAPENSAPLRMSASIASSTEQYRVHSDLNLESLPQSNRDPNRKVWWMNSLAASVLGIGVFLTKEPAEFAFKPVAPEAPMQIEVVQPHVEVLQQVDRQEVPDEPMDAVRTPGWRGGFLGADGWRARWAQRCAVIGAPDWAVPGSLPRNGTTCMDVGAVCGWRLFDRSV